jgi:hypothetical protein
MEPVDFLAEYEEFSSLQTHIAIVYKFFDMFKVDEKEGCVYWLKEYSDSNLNKEVLCAFKGYLKSKKSALRRGELKKGECSKAMLFWYMKILEYNMFDTEVRREIMKFMEVCELAIS